MSPALEHAARRMSPPKVRIVATGVFAGTSKLIFDAPGPEAPGGPTGPWGPGGPDGPAGPFGPVRPRAPFWVGTTDAGSFALRPRGTSRPALGVRDALMPFTAPALRAKFATPCLAAPPAGIAAARARAAPTKATMVRVFST